jgi:hypothetical protein
LGQGLQVPDTLAQKHFSFMQTLFKRLVEFGLSLLDDMDKLIRLDRTRGVMDETSSEGSEWAGGVVEIGGVLFERDRKIREHQTRPNKSQVF